MRDIQRACDVMLERRADDARKVVAIALPTIQKDVHFHVSVSQDLLGSAISTGTAKYFTPGFEGP